MHVTESNHTLSGVEEASNSEHESPMCRKSLIGRLATLSGRSQCAVPYQAYQEEQQSEDLPPNQTLLHYLCRRCILRPRIDCLHAAYEMSTAVQENKHL